jgi:hypothetical protein
VQLYGIDFTSRPSERKPITVAAGRLVDDMLHLDAVHALPDFISFDALLGQTGPWLAVCDFPFGLPRELVAALGWPTDWPALMRHYANHDRAALRQLFQSFCAARSWLA